MLHRISVATLSIALCAPLLCTYEAHAQPSRAQQAVDIGREGLALYEKGLWQQAFDRFEEADRLYHSPVFVLHMARCREKVGALLEARDLFARVVNETPDATDTELWRKARRDAAAEGKALGPRIPILKVMIKNARGGVDQVRVDDRAVPSARLRQGLRLDPGRHTLDAFDGRGARARDRINLDEGQALTVTLDFGRAEPTRPVAPLTTARTSRREPVRWPGIAALSVGVAGVATGIVTGLLAKRDADAVLDGCDDNLYCNDDDESRAERGRSYATVSTVGFAAGGVFLAVGAALVIWPPYASASKDSAIRVAPTLGGATISGAF